MTNIIMLVCGRLNLTRQALESLYAHTDPKEFNLCLVNDGDCGDFRVARLLQDTVERNPNCAMVHVVKSQHVIGRAKNLGVYWNEQTFGRGDWLYLSDNDVYFTQGWLPKLTQMASNSEEALDFALWGGQVHPFHKHTNTLNSPHDGFKNYMTTHDILDGPSWLMRWDTWDTYGPFSSDCAPGPCQSEEYRPCAALVNDGLGIGVINPHVVYHTGLTNTDGKDAPGRKEREAMRVQGVLYE